MDFIVLLIILYVLIIGVAFTPFFIKKKRESIKGYSIFSIFTFLYGTIPFIFFKIFGSLWLSILGDEIGHLSIFVLPLTILISIILGILSILEIKNKKLKGSILTIIGFITPVFFFVIILISIFVSSFFL